MNAPSIYVTKSAAPKPLGSPYLPFLRECFQGERGSLRSTFVLDGAPSCNAGHAEQGHRHAVVLRVAVLGAEVTSEHKFVGLKCAANSQLSDAFLCLVCFNAEREQPSFERCGMKLSSNSDCEVDLFHMPRREFRDELDVLAVAEILLRFFLFLPAIAGVRRPRKFQDAQLLLGSDGSPESHSVGSFVQEISYVLRARVEPLSAKEIVYLIVNLIDLQRRLRLCSDVADDIFDGPLLDHRTGDNRWEFPLGSLSWARSR